MRVKIFLSEPGWGHIVRQSSIVYELRKVFPELQITIQSKKNPIILKKFFGKFNYIKSDNLIKWFSNERGEIDKEKIKNYYKNYETKSKVWFKKFKKDKNYNFFISDVSPEAFKLGADLKIPTFGVCHFTWDWFFSKISKKLVSTKIIHNWQKYQKTAIKFFFPPFTPKKCLKNYKNHKNINFILKKIVNKRNLYIDKNLNKKIKVLFVDSGDNLMSKILKRILKKNEKNKNIIIFHQKNLGVYKNAISFFKKNIPTTLMMNKSDIIIGRAGFNTVTEVLKLKKPSIFINDDTNPEMNWNTSFLEKNFLSNCMEGERLLDDFE